MLIRPRRSALNMELWKFLLPLCSTQLNIYVLDKVRCLQGGPVGGRLESMAGVFYFNNRSPRGEPARSAITEKKLTNLMISSGVLKQFLKIKGFHYTWYRFTGIKIIQLCWNSVCYRRMSSKHEVQTFNITHFCRAERDSLQLVESKQNSQLQVHHLILPTSLTRAELNKISSTSNRTLWILKQCVLYSVLIMPSDWIYILYVIYLIYIVVRFYQYKANLSWIMQDYGTSVGTPVPWSLSSAQRCCKGCWGRG